MQTGHALLLPGMHFSTLFDRPNRLTLGKDFNGLADPQSKKRLSFQDEVRRKV